MVILGRLTFRNVLEERQTLSWEACRLLWEPSKTQRQAANHHAVLDENNPKTRILFYDQRRKQDLRSIFPSFERVRGI